MNQADHEYFLKHSQEMAVTIQEEIVTLEGMLRNSELVPTPEARVKIKTLIQTNKELLAECQKDATLHSQALRKKQ